MSSIGNAVECFEDTPLFEITRPIFSKTSIISRLVAITLMVSNCANTVTNYNFYANHGGVYTDI